MDTIEQSDLRTVQATLTTAAAAIARLPRDQWPGWIVFLMELLDTSDSEYEEVLTHVMKNIQTRIEKGIW